LTSFAGATLLVQSIQHLHNFRLAAGIQVAGRLIGGNQAGLGHEGAGLLPELAP